MTNDLIKEFRDALLNELQQIPGGEFRTIELWGDHLIEFVVGICCYQIAFEGDLLKIVASSKTAHTMGQDISKSPNHKVWRYVFKEYDTMSPDANLDDFIADLRGCYKIGGVEDYFTMLRDGDGDDGDLELNAYVDKKYSFGGYNDDNYYPGK